MPKPIATTTNLSRAQPVPGAGPRRWLILVHQLPPLPSNLRVRTWRRLQELGAVAVKQSVYVLPDTPESREDFEWLKVEIEGAGGEAIVYSADHVDPAAEAALIEQFRHVRQQAYTELASELQRIQRPRASRQGPSGRRRDLARYRERFAAIERVDFFGSAGRDRVVTLLADLEAAAPSAAKGKGQHSHRRSWRCGSIRRPPLGDAPATGRRSDGLGMAHPAVHRFERAVCIHHRRQDRWRCASLRHVRRRFRPRGGSLHVRDAHQLALASPTRLSHASPKSFTTSISRTASLARRRRQPLASRSTACSCRRWTTACCWIRA